MNTISFVSVMLLSTSLMLVPDETPVIQAGQPLPTVGILPVIQEVKDVDAATRHRIQLLETQFRNEEQMATAAEALINLAGDLFAPTEPFSRSSKEASRIGRNLFLSSSPPAVRAKAFGMYQAGYPWEYRRHVRELTIIVPGVTCFGRLEDSFRDRLVAQHDWIWNVKLENSHHQDLTTQTTPQGGLLLGNDALVTITIDRSKTAAELKTALVESHAYQMQHWRILIPQPLLDLK